MWQIYLLNNLFLLFPSPFMSALRHNGSLFNLLITKTEGQTIMKKFISLKTHFPQHFKRAHKTTTFL